MTRARWIAGGVIGAGALVVAIEALTSYVSGQLVVGVVSVIVLMGVLALGTVSLVRAHKFITGELAALGAKTPGGELYRARRQQALELRDRGVTPDLDVLADATAAQEAERGYTGKYLVATTVLIGLVGTFGGLMETLARVAPLLKGDLLAGGTSTLGLIAGPLAGLHVTFGTSVVAIMVTLALALVQGDVTLRHERLLALLQERTRHVLIPELWPAEESAGERTVRALLGMRASVTEALTAGAEANAAKISAAVRGEVQRLVDDVAAQLREVGRAQNAAVERASAAAAESVRQTVDAAAQELRASAAASRQALESAAASFAATAKESDARKRDDVERVARAVEAAAATQGESLRKELAALAEHERANLAQAVAATMDHARSTQAQNAELVAQAVTGLDDAAAALTAASAQTSAAFEQATSTAVDALAAASARSSASFSEAAAAAAGALASASAQSSTSFSEATSAAVEALATASAQSSTSFTEATSAAVEALASASAQGSASFTEATSTAVGALTAASSQTSAAFTEAASAAVGALAEVRGGLSADLGAATQALSTAATELEGTARALAPALAQLAPQLGALATEVALLAARADTPEQPNAVLDELVRLGEDVERLVAANVAAPSVPQPAAEDAGS
jgi:hypothetical protein